MKRIYFDYAATTPVDLAVEKEMAPYFDKFYGNPGSLHYFGQEASAAVFNSRKKIANTLNCFNSEIIFTGSATEANNLVLRGILKGYRSKVIEKNLNLKSYTPRPKIIISSIEHESIIETCRDIEKKGVKIIYISVSKEGIVDLKILEKSLDENVILVSIMAANNEIGVIQPIAEISKIIKNFRKEKVYPLIHTDAVQAFNYLNCSPRESGVDFMTLSSHKIYGPKGIGMLYVSDKCAGYLSPIITGGGQENGFRSGTENVAAIIGFAKAVEIAEKIRFRESKRILEFQKYFFKKAEKLLPLIKLNGSIKQRLPNNLNIYFPGFKAQDLLVRLDTAGFAVSSGSACLARTSKPSYIIKALGYPKERAIGSLRITFGKQTNKKQIDEFLEVLKNIIKSR